jgi:hydroxymethylpyrimidine/phosphomethylpyrimidine kinase
MPNVPFIDDPPVALTVAGSDCSSGAGLQADLKTFTTLKVYGLTALTCAVSETPHEVTRIEALPPAFLADQVRLLCQSFPIAAIKTGMLFSAAHVEALASTLEETAFNGSLVVDPVMIATSGAALIEPEAVTAIETRLFPRAALITPNMDEAGALLDRSLNTVADLEKAAIDLREKYDVPTLVKGGHLDPSSPTLTDVLCLAPGALNHFEGPHFQGVHTHGTGCTYASAITAFLARGEDLRDAVRHAHHFVARTIQRSFRWRLPQGTLHALNHQAS